MARIQFLRKKIQNSQLVWLKNSNSYFLLEEPAWFVFNKTIKRYKAETIATEFSHRYGVSINESLKFVTDIRTGMEDMNQTVKIGRAAEQFPKELNSYQFSSYSRHIYRFSDTVVSFSFDSEHLENYIHPLISHQEIEQEESGVINFELFSFGNQVVFRKNDETQGVWGKDDGHLVKGLIFMKLVNAIYNRTDDFWLMTVHASAITNGKKTILITAAPGGGKTTMSALLQHRGFQLVSDDFVPVDRNSLAYPFPISMSVKQGSIDLLSPIFPSLAEKPLNQITSEKIVRYYYPNEQQEFTKKARPVREFIFIKYDDNVDFEWEKLEQVQAVKLLLEQTWLSPAKGVAPIFFEQFEKWSFFKLTYSNNEKALEAIEKLFNSEE